MYEFVNLTDEQRHDRRILLDRYAALAQLSACLPILLIYSSILLSAGYERWLRRSSGVIASQAHKPVAAPLQPRRESNGYENTKDHAPEEEIDLDAEDVYGPSSPELKHRAASWSTRRLGAGKSWMRLRRGWRRAAWWCGEPVYLPFLNENLGSRGEVLGASAWFAWLVAISFVHTGNDYLHLTKRFGIVAASQLPLHYLLTLKTSFSPLHILLGRSHETLINAHQLLGRIIIALFYAHVVLYLNFFIQKNLLAKLTEFYIICGLVAIVAYTVIATTALDPVRRWNYRLFYTLHVSLALVLLPTLFFHVHHIRIYLYETALVYAIHTASRFISAKTYIDCTISVSPHTKLVEITVPRLSAAQALDWHPGQHAYISNANASPFLRPFRTANPFTVSSLPAVDDGKLHFVARIFDGHTAKMAQQSSVSETGTGVSLIIEGPYGLAHHPHSLLSSHRVLFVAGGVGATFIVPLYRQLLADQSPSPGSARRQKVDFIWAVKNTRDMLWALPSDNRERRGFLERLQVWVTRDVQSAQQNAEDASRKAVDVLKTSSASATASETPYERSELDHDESVEHEEQKTLLSSSESVDSSATATQGAPSTTADLPLYIGRPDLARAVDKLFEPASTSPTTGTGSPERVAIVVCGPRTMRHQLRQAVRRWVIDASTDKEIWFWEEKFG